MIAFIQYIIFIDKYNNTMIILIDKMKNLKNQGNEKWKKVIRVADNCYNFLPNCRIHLGIFLTETLEHELFDYVKNSENFIKKLYI